MKKLVVTLLLGSLGCSGEIPKSDDDDIIVDAYVGPELQRVESSGFTATAGSCGNLEDGVAALRFVLLTDSAESIGEGVGLGADAFSFTDTAFFEAASDGQQAEPTDVLVNGAAELISDGTKPQLFGVLVENSGSTEGYLPADVGDLHPDWDMDGIAEGSADFGPSPDRASDRTRQSRASLAVLINNWKAAAGGGESVRSFGMWKFSGTSTAGVVSLVGTVTSSEADWTVDPNVADDSRAAFSSVSGTRANVYMALKHVLETAYAPAEFDGYGKTLVLVVDGPDDLRLPMDSADSVIALAKSAGVRLFIVHFDASQSVTTEAGSPVLRDDPRTWNERVDGAPIQEPCTSDNACNNYESCRVPTAYASSPNGPVETTSAGDRYCMQERDPVNGRFGPIQDYARIACETDGGYIYVREPSGIRPRIDWLPFTMDGLWQLDTTITALQNQEDDSSEMYLQTTMSVTLGGVQRSYDFSQFGEPIATDDGADTRAVVFSGR